MYFVSKSPNFYQGCIPQKLHHHPATGEFLGTTAAIGAQFRQSIAPEWARQVAKQTFKFTGMESDPDNRISWYDTDEEAALHGWSAEQKAEVEKQLLRFAGEYYVQVTPPVLNAPWNGYEKTRMSPRAPKAIARLAAETGEIEAAVAYERYVNDGRSAAILAELEDAQPPLALPEELISA